MSTNETMPLSALPYFLRISASFCNAVDESIDLYKEDQDKATFSKILHHLSTDLNYYLEIYEAWQKDPEAAQHKNDLETFGTYLQDAKTLLKSAVELIRH